MSYGLCDVYRSGGCFDCEGCVDVDDVGDEGESFGDDARRDAGSLGCEPKYRDTM